MDRESLKDEQTMSSVADAWQKLCRSAGTLQLLSSQKDELLRFGNSASRCGDPNETQFQPIRDLDWEKEFTGIRRQVAPALRAPLQE